jgi:hypothetical protein
MTDLPDEIPVFIMFIIENMTPETLKKTVRIRIIKYCMDAIVFANFPNIMVTIPKKAVRIPLNIERMLLSESAMLLNIPRNVPNNWFIGSRMNPA